VAGDLTGVPLLKLALDSAARAVRAMAAGLPAGRDRAISDLIVIGAGPAGVNAALETRKLGMSCIQLDAAEPFATIAAFPVAKPIFTYPRALKPEGTLELTATVKEPLLAELREQARGLEVRRARAERVTRERDLLVVHLVGGEILRARRVLVAIGRSGDYRRLKLPGESQGHVSNRLHDPKAFAGRRVLVVGGGDTASETAIALADAGARVMLAHRGAELARCKPENDARVRERAGSGEGRIELRLRTLVRRIGERDAELEDGAGHHEVVPADAVFVMIGREAPLGFLRRSGVAIAGERTRGQWLAMAAFMLACAFLYNWKSGGFLTALWSRNHWFPTNVASLAAAVGGAVAAQAAEPGTLLGTLVVSASSPSFWYTLAYSAVIVGFGIRRIRRRRTPYITAQTLTLMAVQVVPLFLLPEVVLPLLGAHGLLPTGLADALFPRVDYGHGREYWRAYGFILAWPLNVYNVFTHQPLWAWIGIGFVQTFVLLPLGVWRFGKGFYCGWICSCGGLAETLGDDQRGKMPHGPLWNRANLAGQVLLALAFVLLAVRVLGWILPGENAFTWLFESQLEQRWKWWVDVGLAGVLGYGAYFWFSGRVWCRFLCPLAALLHIYARFSRFAIVAEKAKCISCNQCTSACHMGIDVMAPAQRGEPMRDPECVRCSACVHACPTGVLQFASIDARGFVSLDSLAASPVRMRERE
jgi:thioredoxin reductase/NAD-dependent dihydropyrimidine dehydrogenase PreA subunit